MIADILGGQASAAVPKRPGLVAEVLAEERLKPPPPVPAPGRGLIGRILAEEGAKSTPAPLPVPASVAADAFPPPAVMPPSRTELPPNAIPAWLRATEWGLSNVVAPALEFGRIINPVTRLAAAGYERFEPESTRVIREEMARADWGPRIPDWRFPEQVPLVGGQQVFPSQDVPVVGPYLGVGTQPLKTATELTGIGIMGPAFPLGFGMNAAAESLEGGRPLPEVVATGLTAGMGAYMGGKALGLVGERLAPKNVVRVGDTWVRKEFAELAKRAMEQQEVTGGGPGIPAEWRPIGRLEALMGDQLRRTAQRIKDYFRERGREPAGREMRLAADAVMRGEAGARERLARAALRYNERGGRAFRDLMDYVVGPVAQAAPEPVLQLPPGAERGAALVPSRADLRVAVEQLGLTGLNLNALLRAIRKAGGDVAEGAAGLVGQKAAHALAARLAGAMGKPGPAEAEGPPAAATPGEAVAWGEAMGIKSHPIGTPYMGGEKPAQAAPETKQAWEMTRSEFVDAHQGMLRRPQGKRRLYLQVRGGALHPVPDTVQRNGKLLQPIEAVLAAMHGGLVQGHLHLQDNAQLPFATPIDLAAAKYPVPRAVLEDYRGRPWADAALAKIGGEGAAEPAPKGPGLVETHAAGEGPTPQAPLRAGQEAPAGPPQRETAGQVVPGPAPRDLLGQAVTGTEIQKSLIPERGLPAVWRRIEGVEYVLTQDGHYATRADGTGGLIPKDDAEAIRADAAKAVPSRPPAAETEGPPTAAAPPTAAELAPFALAPTKPPRPPRKPPAPPAVPSEPLPPVPEGEPVPPVKTVSQATDVRREARRLLEQYEEAAPEKPDVENLAPLIWRLGKRHIYLSPGEYEYVEGRPGARHFTKRETFIGPDGKVTRYLTADLLSHEIAVAQDKPAVDAMSEGEIVEGILRQAERLEGAGTATVPERLRMLAHALTRDNPAVATDMWRVADQLDALRYATREELLEGEVKETKRQAREMIHERVDIERTVARTEKREAVREVRAGAKEEAEEAAWRKTLAQMDHAHRQIARLRVRLAAKTFRGEVLKEWRQAMVGLPADVRGVLSRQGEPTNALELQLAVDQISRELKVYKKKLVIEQIKTAARILYNHAREFDPRDPEVQSLIARAGRARGDPNRLLARSLKTLEDFRDAMQEAWHEHHTENLLLAAERAEKADALAAEIVLSLPKKELAHGEPGRPGTPEAGVAVVVGRRVLHAGTLIEEHMGGEDGAAYRTFVGFIQGADEAYYGAVIRAEEMFDASLRQNVGGDQRSEAFITGALEPVTIHLPTLGTVTMPRAMWLGEYLNLQDPGTWDEAFGAETERWPGFKVEADRTAPRLRWTPRDADVFLDHMAIEEGPWVKVARDVMGYLNDQARFDETDRTHHAITGRHMVQVHDRWGRQRERQVSARQGPLEAPASAKEWALQIAGRYKERVPGSPAPILIRNPFAQFKEEVYGDAAFNAFGPPIRDAWTVLGAPTTVQGDILTLEGQITNRLGRDMARTLRDHLRYKMAAHHLDASGMAGVPPAEQGAMRAIGRTVTGILSWRLGPVLNQFPSMLGSMADTRPLSPESWLAGVQAAFSGDYKGFVADLERLSPSLRYRWNYQGAEALVTSSLSGRRGLSGRAWWRVVQRFVDLGLRPMVEADRRVQVAKFAGFLDQLARKGVTGEKARVEAARLTLRMVNRTDVPQGAGFESTFQRMGGQSAFWRLVTVFKSGPNQYVNQVYRAFSQFKKDGDVKGFAWRLAVLVAAMPAAFMGVAATMAWAYRGFRPRKNPQSVGWDVLENTVGNVYGVNEALRMVRARSAYDVRAPAAPPVAAVLRAAEGMVGLRTAIEKGSGRQAATGALGLARGIASLAGLPLDSFVLPVRAAVRAASRKEVVGGAKAAGEAKGAAEGEAGDRRLLAASGQGGGGERAVAALRATGMTLPAARTALRAAMRRAGIGFQERMERLRLLTSRWRESGRRAA